MVTGPLYDASGGTPSLDFANTVDRTSDRPWVDRLRGFADLVAWSEAAGTLNSLGPDLLALAVALPGEAEAVMARARELREACYRVFLALSQGLGPASADLERLNAELARALSRARIRAAGGSFEWGWAVAPPELDLPLWPIARAAAELLTSLDSAHIKRCASDTCLWLFLDRSKNHSRRWCDMKACGNRAKVRRHRRRAAQG